MSGAEDLARVARDGMAVHRVPGAAVAVVAGGRTDFVSGFGIRAAGSAEPMTATTLAQGGSLAKLITALAAMRLAERREVDLDRDANEYLRGWKVPANGSWQPRVTLRQLLGHTSGAAGGGFPGYQRGSPLPSVPDILAGRPPANTPAVRITAIPGTIFRYSGGGTMIVQQLLGDLSGQPFGELMHDLVLAPAGMSDSTFAQPLPPSRWPEAAAGHHRGGAPVAEGWNVYPEQAAAGLWTTARDIALLMADLQRTWRTGEGVLLRRPSLQEMAAPQADGGAGLGLWAEAGGANLRLVHHGDTLGFACCLVAYLGLGIGAVVLTNGAAGAALYEDLVDAIAAEYGWPPLAPGQRLGRRWRRLGAAQPPPDAIAACAGDYRLPRGGQLRASAAAGVLAIAAEGQQPVPLRPVSATRYYAEVLDLEVEFNIGPAGSATGLVCWQGTSRSLAERVAGPMQAPWCG
jgi:CubicO group peptidase (beta-lactamase class C family)